MNNLSIFILAGGFGTRLKSVISDVPKPMAPIDNTPFLEYQINEIKKYFPKQNIYLLTHYLSEVIESYFKDDSSIIILKERNPLDTGGSIKNAIHQLGLNINQSILVFNGDTYIKPNLEEMIKHSVYDVSILGSFQKEYDRYGTLTIKNDRIISFNQKEIGVKNSFINAGCYYFKNLHFFNQVEEMKFAIEDKFKTYLLNNNINIFRYDGIFIDIGIPEDYHKMINYIKEENNANR